LHELSVIKVPEELRWLAAVEPGELRWENIVPAVAGELPYRISSSRDVKDRFTKQSLGNKSLRVRQYNSVRLFYTQVSLPDPANASDLAQVVRATESELSDDLQKLVALPV